MASVGACPVKGRGGRSETPTANPNHCLRDNSSGDQPMIREQGPKRLRGRAMSHKGALAVTGPQDETGGGGGRGSPLANKYEGRPPKRDHTVSTMPTVPNRTLSR